ncbi:hypothetical protein AgCh_022210 [Apium graveolens]
MLFEVVEEYKEYNIFSKKKDKVSQNMGIDAPIPISTKLGDLNNVFRRITKAAEHPHLSIPKTEAMKSRKQYNQLINRSLMIVLGLGPGTLVGSAAFDLFPIHDVCVVVPKAGELKKISDLGVWLVEHFGTAVTLVGMAAYRVYAAAKKNSSG